MENKQFTTLTIRNLDSDENEDIIEILNEFAYKRNLKTGQSIFFEIVRNYKYLEEELRHKRLSLSNLNKEFSEYKAEAELKIEDYEETFRIFKQCMSKIMK